MNESPLPFPAATAARADPGSERLLYVDPRTGRFTDRRVADLPELLAPGDIVVLNDAATVPASLRARTPAGEPFEIRLLSHLGGTRWRAVLFGAGDWRTPTEHRPRPPSLIVEGALGPGPSAASSGGEGRLVDVTIGDDAGAMWERVYREGRAVQYAYRTAEVALEEMQTPWAGRPWAVEMLLVGRSLTRVALLALCARGVEVAWVTHAAGLSSTGDAELDARLPFPERYDVPAPTVAAIDRARAAGARVVAVGTTVVRALEGAARNGRGRLEAGEGVTDLHIDRSHEPRVVDALLSGIHAPGESHFALLEAFAPRGLLRRAAGHAASSGYLAHELGDSMLLLRSRPA